MMHRETFIERLTEVQQIVSSCWPNFRPASTTSLRLTSTVPAGNTAQLAIDPAKAEKQNELCLISTLQIAESMGFKGDFRQ